jgi:hypothetical protein
MYYRYLSGPIRGEKVQYKGIPNPTIQYVARILGPYKFRMNSPYRF